MKIKVWVATNKVGSRCERSFEVDAEEWENMDDLERDELAQEAMWNMVEWSYEEEEE